MIQRLDRITLVALCVILASAPAARAENYAVFFAGGYDEDENWEVYYEEVHRHYEHVVGPWGYKPENVWIIFADGRNGFADLTMWIMENENSDWSYPHGLGTTVLEASYANTQAVLTGFQQGLGPGDLFYFWSYDHGFGDKDKPTHHDEEGFSGWNQWEANDIPDDHFANWVNPIGAGRHAYVLGQCYSGGILEELDIWPGSNRFGCASATHQEPSQSGECFEGFNDAWCDAVEEEDAVYTHDLYQLAYEDTDRATDGQGPNAPYSWNVQHPWKIGDDLFLPVCVWEGAGAGGSSHALDDPSNWSYAIGYGRSARVELTSGASLYVDAPITVAGYLTLNWDPSIGTGGMVLVNATGMLFCQTINIGQGDAEWLENEGFGYLVINGGHVTVDEGLVVADYWDDAGELGMIAGRLNVNGGIMVVGDNGVGEFNQGGGEVHLDTHNVPLYLGRESHGEGTYRLQGDLFSADVYVGYDGTGTLEQTSGAHTSSGTVYVGLNEGSEGTYTVTGGTLTAGSISVGMSPGAEGTFTFSGTLANVTVLTVGYTGTGTAAIGAGQVWADAVQVGVGTQVAGYGDGTLEISGGGLGVFDRFDVGHWGDGVVTQTDGDVWADSMVVGRHGEADQVAEYVQTGGTTTIATDLWVGGGPSEQEAKGRYVLGGTGVLHVGRNLKVGSQGIGTFEHENGTVTIGGALLVGALTGNGTYRMGEPGGSDPSLTVASHVALGLDNLSAMAAFLHCNGTHTVGGNLYVGMDWGRQGTYILGSYYTVLDVQGEAYVGYLGTGKVSHGAGTFTVGTDLTLGYGNGATGTYVIRDGTLDVSNGTITIGVDGDATFEFDYVHGNDEPTVIADEFVLGPDGEFLSDGEWGTLRVNVLTGFGSHPEFAGSVEFGHSGGAGIGGYEITSTGGSFTCGRDLVVGYDAEATFEQCRELSEVVGNVRLGKEPGGYGTYTLDDDFATLTGGVSVGHGMFYHRSGTQIGGVFVGEGIYEMTDGTLTGTGLMMGGVENSMFRQTGGEVTFDEEMVIGAGASTSGTYEKTGGTLEAGSMVVGESGSGMFMLRNSNATFTGDVVVAEDANEDPYPPSSGTIDVEVGRFSCAMLDVGRDGSRPGTPSVGTVRQGVASRVECTTLRLAYGGEATYTMDSGAFNLTTDTVHVGWSGTANFIQNAGTHTATSLVEIGGHVISEVWHGDGEGDYTMMGGTLSVPTLVVGETYVGRLAQQDGSNSTVTAGDVTLGRVSDGDGTYTLYDGQLECASLTVGDHGTGVFHHSDTVGVSGFLYVSREPGSHGTYNFDSGDLSAGMLRIGNGPGTDGTFNWTWGTLDADTVEVIEGGTMNVSNSWAFDGELELRGGALDLDAGTKNLWLDAPDPGASMTIYDGSIYTLNQTIAVEHKATATQMDGTNTVVGFLEVGVGIGSEGIYDLQGGELNVGTLRIGSGGMMFSPQQGGELGAGELGDNGGSGQFTWTGGMMVAETVEVNANGTMDVGVAWPLNGYLYLYGGAVNSTGPSISLGTGGGVMGQGGTGVAEIHDGTLTANCLCLGYAGTGIVTQLGGTVTGNILWIGHQGPGEYTYESGDLTMDNILVKAEGTLSVAMDWTYGGHLGVEGGTVDLAEGSLTLDAPGDGATADLSGGLTGATNEYVGYAAKATVTQTGGDNFIGAALYLGHEVGSEGIYNLEGGTLTVPEIYVGVLGSALLRWTGGTLDAEFITVGPGGEFALALTQGFEGDLYCPDGGKVTVDLGSEVTLSGIFGIDPGAAFGKDGEGMLIIDGPQQHGPGASFDILGGTVDMNTDAGQGGFVDVSILVDDAVLLFGCDQYLDTLALDNGALVRFTGAGVVVVQHLVMDGVDLGAATLTPEPATLLLLTAGAATLLARRRRPARA